MSIQGIKKQVEEDPPSRLRNLVSSNTQRIEDSFLQSVEEAKRDRSLEELAELITQGRIEEALDFVEAIPELIFVAIIATFILSGTSTASFISRAADRPMVFDQLEVTAIDVLRRSRLRLIREFTTEQRNSLRQVLISGISRGINPRQQAREFRDSIGLTTRQVQAVERYRTLLEQGSSEALNRELRDRRFDSTVRRSIRTNTPLESAQINRMVDRYRERYLRYRSEVIGRTEALRAVHQASEETYQQAFNQGILDPNLIIRTWITAEDSRVRDSHNGMQGQQRPVGEAFISDAGNSLRYPGDENAPVSETAQCRCVLTTRFL